MEQSVRIKNAFGEKLDVLLEGNESALEAIIFVHGFGTDKDEGFASFLDLSKAFQSEYFIVRYDTSGYGKSEGQEEEFQFQKSAGDLNTIIRYIRKHYPEKQLNIIAHSLGTFATALLCPGHIAKTVFTGAINLQLSTVADMLKERIVQKGGEINLDGISTYPRSSGATQKIGRDFWRMLYNADMQSLLEDLANETELIVFHSKQDEIVGSNESFDEYKNIPNLTYVEIDGDHNFSKPKDREALIDQIRLFLAKETDD